MDKVLCFAAGNDNEIATDANANRIIFTIKDKKLYVPVKTLSARDNQKHKLFVVKNLKDLFIGMNIKQKVKMKYSKWIDIYIFLNQILLELIDYLL